MVGAFVGAGTIKDPDVFWHLLVGDQIRATSSLSDLGADWTLTTPETSWQTSQWASEVVMSALHSAGGLEALIVIRAAAGIGLMLGIAALLLSRATPRASVVLMTLAALSVAPLIQDRPQTASLVLTVWLSWRISGLLRGGRGPSVWEVGAITWVWAQFHGLWILVPAAFGVLVLGRLIEGRDARPALRQALLLTAVSVVAGLINPLGLKSLLLPLTFAGNTSLIQEWARTSLSHSSGVLLLVLIALTAWMWARSQTPIPRSEIVHIVAWSAFAFLAIRNVPTGMLLIAPVVAGRLSGYLPRAGKGSVREQLWLRIALVAVLIGGSAATLGRAATVDPLAGAAAAGLSAVIAQSPEPVRVLNDYNASGILLYKAADVATLGIDGRADRLGGEYTNAYIDAQNLRREWRSTLEDLDPDLALIRTDLPLTTWLREVEGWTVVDTDGDLSLLARDRKLADELA